MNFLFFTWTLSRTKSRVEPSIQRLVWLGNLSFASEIHWCLEVVANCPLDIHNILQVEANFHYTRELHAWHTICEVHEKQFPLKLDLNLLEVLNKRQSSKFKLNLYYQVFISSWVYWIFGMGLPLKLIGSSMSYSEYLKYISITHCLYEFAIAANCSLRCL